MKLFLISQSQNQEYDTFDSAVVCAPDEEAARNMNPSGDNGAPMTWGGSLLASTWCNDPKHVTVKLLGTASDDLHAGVVCASFNAG